MDSTLNQRFYVSTGDQVTFAKTISESDVDLFAGITGDFAQTHVNAEYIKGTDLGQCVRFIKPVFIGDTITVTYTIAEIDAVKRRSRATVEAHNQRGQIIAAAQHLIQWVRRAS